MGEERVQSKHPADHQYISDPFSISAMSLSCRLLPPSPSQVGQPPGRRFDYEPHRSALAGATARSASPGIPDVTFGDIGPEDSQEVDRIARHKQVPGLGVQCAPERLPAPLDFGRRHSRPVSLTATGSFRFVRASNTLLIISLPARCSNTNVLPPWIQSTGTAILVWPSHPRSFRRGLEWILPVGGAK